MNDDIVEFGAPPAPKPKRLPQRRSRPGWMASRMLPVAAAGAVAAAASLILPWQKLAFRRDEISEPTVNPETYQAAIIHFDAHGPGYLLTLIATMVTVVLVFHGQPGVLGVARVIGATLSCANLVILTTMALALTKGTAINAGFVFFGPTDVERMTSSLELGFYAAMAAVLALGVAALRAKPLPLGKPDEGPVDEDDIDEHQAVDEDPDGDVIDLSVSVHPVGKQVAAG